MKINNIYAHVTVFFVGCLVSSFAYSAMTGPELTSFPWVQILLSGVLALWGGLTRTASKNFEAHEQARTANPPTAVNFDLKQHIIKDVVVSSGIGLFLYFVGASLNWSGFYLGAALWIGGYMGTTLLSGITESVLNRIGAMRQENK